MKEMKMKMKMNMNDRISTLPDEILCHILSFLSTKKAVTTSVLSKRWKPLWRSVSTLDFDEGDYQGIKGRHSCFVQSVSRVILSRDFHQPIQKFCLVYFSRHFNDLSNVPVWFNNAMQRGGLEHIDISLWKWNHSPLNLSSIFSCKTLVVLKLEGLTLTPFSSVVDLPSLKVLHLKALDFADSGCLAQLLSGCPVLEDFKVSNLSFKKHVTDREFKTLPKLVRADISGLTTDLFMMKVVKYVQILRINKISDSLLHDGEATGMFPNLTRIEFVCVNYISDWFEVVRFLKYCPKLQDLDINQSRLNRFNLDELNLVDWQDPPSVPQCILLHLEECRLNHYRGTNGEFQFAKYIMQNGKFLKKLTITCMNRLGKGKNIQKLSSCTRCSATCELSFK